MEPFGLPLFVGGVTLNLSL